MTRLALVALAAALAGCATPSPLMPIAPNPDVPPEAIHAFVAERIAVESVGQACTGSVVDESGEVTCLYADSVYRGRYRVVESLVGTLPPGEVTVRMAGHGGLPDAVERPLVLLIAAERDGELRLLRYQVFAVQRTQEGRWATCGDPRLATRDGQEGGLVPLRFAPGKDFGPVPAGRNASWLAEDFPADFYTLRNGRIECHHGEYADTVVREVLHGLAGRRR